MIIQDYPHGSVYLIAPVTFFEDLIDNRMMD